MNDIALPREAGALPELLAYWAHETPRADAVIAAGQTLDYAALNAKSDALAGDLAARGVRRGDRICVLAAPSLGFAISLFAAFKVGAIWVGLNPKYKSAEVAHILNDCSPRLVLVHAATNLTEAAAACAEFSGAPVIPLEEDAASTGDGGAPPDATLTASDPGVIVYTSGTTGAPKGAVISQGALRKTAIIQNRLLGLKQPRVLNNLPINHIGSLGDVTLAALAAGGAVIMQAKFNAEEGFKLLQRHRATLWGQIPTMFQLALDDPSADAAELSSLECILFSGAPASPGLIGRLRNICPKVVNAYGMTETVASVTWALDADDDTLAETVGFPVAPYPLRIASADGEALQDGEVGEIQVRGDFHFDRYWNNPDATAAAFTPDGWLKTGDLGRFREDGAVQLSGRLREMFKSGGYNVYPREVELAMSARPGVAECVVVPVPDALFFEVGHAFVMASQGHPLSEADLKSHAEARLANYKRPKRWTILQEYPQLPNGKIDRKALKARAASLQNDTAS